MIGLSTQTYDIVGARLFSGTDSSVDLNNRSGERRLSRTATLDGGVVFTDNGFSDGDRTITLQEPDAGQDAIEYARYIVENYNLVNAATDDGFYEVAPSAYAVSDGVLTMTLLVSEKLSE